MPPIPVRAGQRRYCSRETLAKLLHPGDVSRFESVERLAFSENDERLRNGGRKDDCCLFIVTETQYQARQCLSFVSEYDCRRIPQDIQPRRFGDRQKEDCALEAVRLQRRRDHDVGIDDQPERDHPRFDLAARAA